MKNLNAWAVGAIPLFACEVTLAQTGNMMNGSMWGGGWMGGYGGMWVPALFLIAVVALVVWIVKRGGK